VMRRCIEGVRFKAKGEKGKPEDRGKA